jgi:hypothetical protein
MPAVLVEVVRYVDDHFPGRVECALTDVNGMRHLFEEKISVVTTQDLWSNSSFPTTGAIQCNVLAMWSDQDGSSRARVDTSNPWGIESLAGESVFVVSSKQLVGV